jgi:hypothetical protein
MLARSLTGSFSFYIFLLPLLICHCHNAFHLTFLIVFFQVFVCFIPSASLNEFVGASSLKHLLGYYGKEQQH